MPLTQIRFLHVALILVSRPYLTNCSFKRCDRLDELQILTLQSGKLIITQHKFILLNQCVPTVCAHVSAIQRCCCLDDGIMSSAPTVKLRTRLGLNNADVVAFTGGKTTAEVSKKCFSVQKVKNRDWSKSLTRAYKESAGLLTQRYRNELAQKEESTETIWSKGGEDNETQV